MKSGEYADPVISEIKARGLPRPTGGGDAKKAAQAPVRGDPR